MDEASHGCCLFGQRQPQAVVFHTRLRSDGKFRLQVQFIPVYQFPPSPTFKNTLEYLSMPTLNQNEGIKYSQIRMNAFVSVVDHGYGLWGEGGREGGTKRHKYYLFPE